VAVALRDLPKYLVLEPASTVRIEIRLESPSCEIDVELDSPRPGRSFVLLIGHREGPFVQRVRLAGRARIHFDPQSPGDYVLLLANPDKEPVVLRLRGRDLGKKVLRPTIRPAARRSSRGAAKAARTVRRERSSRPARS
jgi:hypothetical protein